MADGTQRADHVLACEGLPHLNEQTLPVKLSTDVKALNLLPLNNASDTKSMLQSWLGAFNSGRSSRVAAVRCRRGRLVRKFKSSSLYNL